MATPILDAHCEGLRAHAVRALLAEDPRDVLDAGAGAGGLLSMLREAGVPARGIERDEAAVAAARAKGLDVAPGDATALDLPDGAADWVVLRHVLHHVEDPARAVREAWRVAKTGVLLAEPCFTTGLEEHAPTARFEGVLRALDRASGMHHARDHTPAEMIALLRDAAGDAQLDVRVEVHAPLTRLPEAEAAEQLERSRRGRALDAAQQAEADALLALAREGRMVPNGSALVIARRSA